MYIWAVECGMWWRGSSFGLTTQWCGGCCVSSRNGDSTGGAGAGLRVDRYRQGLFGSCISFADEPQLQVGLSAWLHLTLLLHRTLTSRN